MSAVADGSERPIVICVVEDGLISYASETTTEVSGFPPDWFRGRHVSELVHPDDHALLRPLAEEGWTGDFDVAVRLQDSDKRWTWRRVWGCRKVDEVGRPFAVVSLRKIAH